MQLKTSKMFDETTTFYTPWKLQKASGFVIFSGGYKKRPVAWSGLTNLSEDSKAATRGVF